LSPIGNKKLVIDIGAIIGPLRRRTRLREGQGDSIRPSPPLAGSRLPAGQQIAL
jgi:hypothetical protein